MSKPEDLKSFEFEARGVDHTLHNINRLIRALESLRSAGYTTLYILERLGLPRDISDAIRVLHTLYLTIQSVRAALAALEIQMGPAAWALIGVAIAGGIVLSLEL